MPTPRHPLKLPPQFSPGMADLFERLQVIAQDQRMTLLVDYLGELRAEFDAVAAELAEHGFCAPCYLSALDDGDDHDCLDA